MEFDWAEQKDTERFQHLGRETESFFTKTVLDLGMSKDRQLEDLAE